MKYPPAKKMYGSLTYSDIVTNDTPEMLLYIAKIFSIDIRCGYTSMQSGWRFFNESFIPQPRLDKRA